MVFVSHVVSSRVLISLQLAAAAVCQALLRPWEPYKSKTRSSWQGTPHLIEKGRKRDDFFFFKNIYHKSGIGLTVFDELCLILTHI